MNVGATVSTSCWRVDFGFMEGVERWMLGFLDAACPLGRRWVRDILDGTWMRT